ncbi:hypothetical protein MRX96_013938 [Rhipicephalus microplus]
MRWLPPYGRRCVDVALLPSPTSDGQRKKFQLTTATSVRGSSDISATTAAVRVFNWPPVPVFNVVRAAVVFRITWESVCLRSSSIFFSRSPAVFVRQPPHYLAYLERVVCGASLDFVVLCG